MNTACSQLKTVGWSPHTILDIGAFKGNWTRDIRLQFPNARFTLVEPNDNTTLRSLKDRIVNHVLSDTVKDVEWFSNGSTGDSMFRERTRHYSDILPTSRRTTTLDILFSGESFDFIKIDCQGAELDILRGGEILLRQTEVVLLECAFAGQYNQGAPTFAEYIAYMDSIGFAPLDVTELHRANGFLCQVDILFVRKTSALCPRVQDRIGS